MSSTSPPFDYKNHTWDVIDSYFKNVGLVSHQIGSYNYFIDHLFPTITKQYNPISINFQERKRKKKDANKEKETQDTNDKLESLLVEGRGEKGDDIHNVGTKIDHSKYTYSVFINFDNPVLNEAEFRENTGKRKKMSPYIARMRNFTYSCPIKIDVIITTVIKRKDDLNGKPVHTDTKCIPGVEFGSMPIMLKSKCCILSKKDYLDQNECPNDPGGYFIISGKEKVIVSQDECIVNMPMVNNKNGKFIKQGELVSISKEKFGIVRKFEVKITQESAHRRSTIKAVIPHIKHEIPIAILFRALGLTNDYEIASHILMDINVKEHSNILCLMNDSFEEAYACLKKKKQNLINQLEEKYKELKSTDEITPDEIVELDDELKIEIEALDSRNTKEEAYDYLIDYITLYYKSYESSLELAKKKYLTNVFKKEFLPNIGVSGDEQNLREKIMQTAFFTNKVLKVHCGKADYDSQDGYNNKRIHNTGILMANLYKMLINKLVKEMRDELNREFKNGAWRSTHFSNLVNETNIYNIIKSTNIIDSGMKYAIGTGNWGAQKFSNKKGISQDLNRWSYKSSVSHLRRVTKAIDTSAKLVAPRQLDSTQEGYMCPAETPEGKNVGVVKNLALSAQITNNHSEEPILSIIDNYSITKVYDISVEHLLYPWCKVFINGRWHCILNKELNPNTFVNELRQKRSLGLIHNHISITWYISDNIIMIYTDSGRCIRPLYRVKNNKLLITDKHIYQLKNKQLKFNELFQSNSQTGREALIEYIDTEELENCLVAENFHDLTKDKGDIPYNYTHCELHPALMFGILATDIPFPDHNQSPRNSYQSSMGKQAMGTYALNFNKRIDTLSHVLHYPEHPIVGNRIMRMLPTRDMSAGINAIVAVATFTGYNQEDSVIINQNAIDRGLYQSTFYRGYKSDESKNTNASEDSRFGRADKITTKGMKYGNYSKLDENGFISENMHVKGNDAIIGKLMPVKNRSDKYKYKDSSTLLRSNEEGYVDKVFVSRNDDGFRVCKVLTRSIRVPGIGDKFSSRHGQKGIDGVTYRQEDMPFTAEGITPDLIMNPHAVPSRMTIGHLMETVCGKAGVNIGKYGDGTPFTDVSVEDISDILEKTGYQKHGDELMYDPRTGKQFISSIFIGPTYYQRLKHMVMDKMHSRAKGPVANMTRQPTEGRNRDGGFRVGEMERDALIAYGVSSFLKETMLERSDNYKVHICKICNDIAQVNRKRNIYYCKRCSSTSGFAEIRIPYSMKLMKQEVGGMNIGMGLISE